jgi:hypothetical protein
VKLRVFGRDDVVFGFDDESLKEKPREDSGAFL